MVRISVEMIPLLLLLLAAKPPPLPSPPTSYRVVGPARTDFRMPCFRAYFTCSEKNEFWTDQQMDGPQWLKPHESCTDFI